MANQATSRSRLWLLCPVFAVLGMAGCTTSDDVIDEIAATRAIFVDFDLSWQNLDEPERVQVAEWDLLEATLDLDGTELDLLIGDECRIIDTVFAFPSTVGRCVSGLVIDANPDEPRPVALVVVFNMQVRRARAPDLPGDRDYDADGVSNSADICPLVRDTDQDDADSDGFGDACSLVNLATLQTSLDSDGDGIPDGFDNCVWEGNPDQADTDGTSAEGVPDGIGDACDEQVAVVRTPAGDTEIRIPLPSTDLLQPENVLSYLTVDFNVNSALTCFWDQGYCVLDTDQVEFCVNEDIVSASAGCP